MHDDDAHEHPADQPGHRPRIRAVSLDDRLVVLDRQRHTRWLQTDTAVPLSAIRRVAMRVGYTSNRCRYIMSMGNYMSARALAEGVMATKEPTVGMDHPTVRPANFDPDTEGADEDSTSSEQ